MANNNIINPQGLLNQQPQQNGVSQQMIQNQQIQQNGISQQTVQNQQTQQMPLYNYGQQAYGNPYYQNSAINPYAGYQQWENYQNQQPPIQQQVPVQSTQQTQDLVEYILLDGSAPNKKRKYVFVGEVDMQTNVVQPLPSFSLEDVRNVVAHEFDTRFGEEKK